MTPARQAALRALHDDRRGVRQRPDSRERETILADVASAVREPVYRVRSIRVVAAYCRVSDRTVRRWLSGEDWPPATAVRRMAEWVRGLGATPSRLT